MRSWLFTFLLLFSFEKINFLVATRCFLTGMRGNFFSPSLPCCL